MQQPSPVLDPTDREIVKATQEGFPLTPDPFGEIGARLGLTDDQVVDRLRWMSVNGLIRRIGVVPNHYKLGYTANGMSVWDVDDADVEDLGQRVGALPFVSHCYRRPRHLPVWPYNLFAMVHGRTREDVSEKVTAIADVLGEAQRGHEVLYSRRILKKTGLRIGD